MNDHRTGPAPSRGTKVTLSLGLVSLPLSIFPGTESGSAVKRSQFTTDGHPVGNMNYDKVTGEPYTGDVLKKVVLDKTTSVELTDDEIEAVAGGPLKGTAGVDAFISLDALVSTYVVTDVKQARPAQSERAGKKFDDPQTIKVFSLLCAAMAEAKVAALFRLTLRSVTRYAALCPDGRLAMLAFADEVRADLPIPEGAFSTGEQAFMTQMVSTLTVTAPVLIDDTRIKLRDYVVAKAAGGDTAVAVEAPTVSVDTSLEELLAASIAAMKGVAA